MITEKTLEALREKLRIGICVSDGRLYATLAVHSSNLVMLDGIAQIVKGPKSQVRRHGRSFRVYIGSQPTVVEFCEAVLPHLDEEEPLYLELTLAREVAAALWYDRYEIVERFMDAIEEGGDEDADADN